MYPRKKSKLYEFTISSSMREDDDQQQAQNNPNGNGQMGGGNQQDFGATGADGMQQGDVPMQGMSPDMGNAGGMPQGGQPDMGAQPNANGQEGMPETEPQADMAQGLDIPDDGMGGFDGPVEDIDMDVDPDTMQPGDEVIDVDELTNAQEMSAEKIDGVDEKLTTLGQVVKKFIAAIEQNDAKIDELKAEFEKRNPTQQEKFNIRSQASGPFTESPREFWEKKVASNPNYQVMYNNEVPTKDEQQEFELRKTDIDGMPDKSVADSFDYPTKLKDILSF